MSDTTGLSVLSRGLRFYSVLDLWLAWSIGLTILSISTCELDTGTGWESISHNSPRPCLIKLLLDTTDEQFP